MGDTGEAIYEEFSLSPEQMVEATALMQRTNSRLLAVVADPGAMSSAAADAAAALAAFAAFGQAYLVLETDWMNPGQPIIRHERFCLATTTAAEAA